MTQAGHCSGKDTLNSEGDSSLQLMEVTVQVQIHLILELIPAHNSGRSLFG